MARHKASTNPDTVAFTGRNAKTGRGHNRKAHARLQARIKDYESMLATRNSAGGAQQRKDGGGYHMPGSNK